MKKIKELNTLITTKLKLIKLINLVGLAKNGAHNWHKISGMSEAN